MTTAEIVAAVERWSWRAHWRTWLWHALLVVWGVYLPVRGFWPAVALVAGLLACLAYLVREIVDVVRGDDSPWWDHLLDVVAPTVAVTLLAWGLG